MCQSTLHPLSSSRFIFKCTGTLEKLGLILLKTTSTLPNEIQAILGLYYYKNQPLCRTNYNAKSLKRICKNKTVFVTFIRWTTAFQFHWRNKINANTCTLPVQEYKRQAIAVNVKRICYHFSRSFLVQRHILSTRMCNNCHW